MAKKDYRTLFLKEFTKSLILNTPVSKREIFPHHPVKQTAEPLPLQIQHQMHPSIIQQIDSSIPQARYQTINTRQPQISIIKPMTQEINPRFQQPQAQTSHFQQIRPQNTRLTSQGMPVMSMPKNLAIANILPMPSQLPPDFSLNKLEQLVRDNRVTVIECPGPGKPVLVKSLGRIIPSQVTLSEQEIKSIIETFSKFAKIPAIGGIFKAAVGNLVITAVLSDYVGSRFIINKYTPYSLIENQMGFV